MEEIPECNAHHQLTEDINLHSHLIRTDRRFTLLRISTMIYAGGYFPELHRGT